MTRTQQTALAAGALAIGSALLSRGLRGTRRMDFNGRIVVITGGSRGLGLLLARQLAEEGAHVTIAARDEAELDRAHEDLASRGAKTHVVVCDVGVREQAERLIHETVERHGRIDLLINNAGVMKVGPLDHMEHADFEEAMAVHFWGPLHTTLAAVPAMRRQGGGRIVNISSIGGKIGVPHLTPYCASKFALTGLSDSLRGELARDQIFVTTVCPGMMRDRFPVQRVVQGEPSRRVHLVCDLRLHPGRFHRWPPRGRTGDRCGAPRRRGTGHHAAGKARGDCQRGRTRSDGLHHGDSQHHPVAAACG